MANLIGTVISYSAQTKAKKRDGGTYDAWELVVRTPNGEIKQVQKPVQGLKFNADLAASLAALVPGEEITLVQEKNAAGFLDVKQVIKGAAQFVQPEAVVQQRGGKVVGSNYETPEERAKRQVCITRMGCLNSAIASLGAGAKSALDPNVVLDLARAYEQFVIADLDAAAKAYQEINK